jgi:hypothetical protein
MWKVHYSQEAATYLEDNTTLIASTCVYHGRNPYKDDRTDERGGQDRESRTSRFDAGGCGNWLPVG